MKMSSYSTTSATVEGLGFAIPVKAAKPILDELISQGYVSGRPAIGNEGQTLDLRTQFFFQMPSGVVITAVEPGSDAAAKAWSPTTSLWPSTTPRSPPWRTWWRQK